MTFVKNNWLMLLVLILVALLYFERCGKKSDVQEVKRDTTVSIQYIQQPPVTVPQYQPIIIESKAPVNIPPQYQASSDQSVLLKQYQDLIDKFLTANISNDTRQLKDSAGNDAGTVNIKDVVSENQIKSRDFSYQLKFPLTTKTITVTQTLKPKGQLYIGGGINGSRESWVNSFEGGLLWKNKKDQIFGVKAGIGTSGKINYGVQSYWKIKLRK